LSIHTRTFGGGVSLRYSPTGDGGFLLIDGAGTTSRQKPLNDQGRRLVVEALESATAFDGLRQRLTLIAAEARRSAAPCLPDAN